MDKHEEDPQPPFAGGYLSQESQMMMVTLREDVHEMLEEEAIVKRLPKRTIKQLVRWMQELLLMGPKIGSNAFAPSEFMVLFVFHKDEEENRTARDFFEREMAKFVKIVDDVNPENIANF